MTPGPIFPQLITPTPTLQWSVATSNQLDDVVSYNLTVSLSVAASTRFPLRIGHSGTGVYDLDWKIDGLDANGELTVSAGVLTHSVRVLVNENLDATEQHILTIEDNGYYLVGATAVHTATCTIGATQPTAANTGFAALNGIGIEDLYVWGSAGESFTLQGTDRVFSRILFDGPVTIKNANNFLFKECLSRDMGAPIQQGFANRVAFNCNQSQYPSNLTFEYCEAGYSAVLANAPARLIGGVVTGALVVDHCKGYDIGYDFVQLWGNNPGDSVLIQNCYSSRQGFGVSNSGQVAHGDFFQLTASGPVSLHNLTLAYNHWDWSTEKAVAAGGSYEANIFAILGEGDTSALNCNIVKCWCGGGNTIINPELIQVSDARVIGCQVPDLQWNGTTGDYVHRLIGGAGTEFFVRKGNKSPRTSLAPRNPDGSDFNTEGAF